MTLYDLDVSGNCYKVRLFAALAQLPLTLQPVDFLGGEHKQPHLLTLNPWGEVPILEDGSVVLRDAQAILVYLAARYGGAAWWPTEAHLQGEVMQWLSVAANEVQHGPNAARLVDKFGYPLDKSVALATSARVLALLDAHLAQHDWLAAGRPTIAECAVYPYLSVAWEGAVDVSRYPQLCAWMARVEALPGFVPMPGGGKPR